MGNIDWFNFSAQLDLNTRLGLSQEWCQTSPKLLNWSATCAHVTGCWLESVKASFDYFFPRLPHCFKKCWDFFNCGRVCLDHMCEILTFSSSFNLGFDHQIVASTSPNQILYQSFSLHQNSTQKSIPGALLLAPPQT